MIDKVETVELTNGKKATIATRRYTSAPEDWYQFYSFESGLRLTIHYYGNGSTTIIVYTYGKDGKTIYRNSEFAHLMRLIDGFSGRNCMGVVYTQKDLEEVISFASKL